MPPSGEKAETLEWESRLDEAVQETEAAKQQVERLNRELGEYASRIDQMAQMSSQPSARATAQGLAGGIRGLQTTATELGVRLGQNVEMKRALQVELKKRIQPQKR